MTITGNFIVDFGSIFTLPSFLFGWLFSSCQGDLQTCRDDYAGIVCPPRSGIDLINVPYCATAQRVITGATSEFKVDVVKYERFASLASSVATPHDGGAQDEPLTTRQYVGMATDTSRTPSFAYEQTITCKMKNAQAINRYFPDAGFVAVNHDCAYVARSFVAAALKNYTFDNASSSLIENASYTVWDTYAGTQWSDSSPAPVAYINPSDGRLFIVSKQIAVDIAEWSPFVGPDKKGVIYCQFIAPGYAEKIARGHVLPPTCTPPPKYEPPFLPIFPPQRPQVWQCANP